MPPIVGQSNEIAVQQEKKRTVAHINALPSNGITSEADNDAQCLLRSIEHRIRSPISKSQHYHTNTIGPIAALHIQGPCDRHSTPLTSTRTPVHI
jgi:hypothetical protein